MYQVYNDEYLMHHGVKGMKWGVRRARHAAKKQARKDKYKASTRYKVKRAVARGAAAASVALAVQMFPYPKWQAKQIVIGKKDVKRMLAIAGAVGVADIGISLTRDAVKSYRNKKNQEIGG